MREALAKSLSGPVNLDEQAHERPVDRLHALASSQIERANRTARASKLASLGVSLIALKHANRADEYARAVERLADLLILARPKKSELFRVTISRQAIMEHCIDLCPCCKGAGEIPAQDGLDGAQRMKVCPECGGHGKRRYTDEERRVNLLLKAEEYNMGARFMAEAMGLIAEAEDQAIRSARQLLERWPAKKA